MQTRQDVEDVRRKGNNPHRTRKENNQTAIDTIDSIEAILLIWICIFVDWTTLDRSLDRIIWN